MNSATRKNLSRAQSVLSGLLVVAAVCQTSASAAVLVYVKNKGVIKTIWSDGQTSKMVNATVLIDGKQASHLETKTASERTACDKGKYPFYYQVDELLLRVGADKNGQLALGQEALDEAKEVLRDHQASCDGMKPLPYEPDSTESYEKTKLTVLALVGNWLAIEQDAQSYSYGRPQPLTGSDVILYQLNDGKLERRQAKLTAANCLSSLIAQAKEYQLAKQAFLAKEPHAFRTASSFVVAPDKQTVVYQQFGKVFLKAGAKKPLLVCSSCDLVGMQVTGLPLSAIQ